MFLLPIIQSLVVCNAVGTNIKDLQIIFKNDEVDYLDCHRYNIDGCVFDKENNQTLSCIILNHLSSLYTLVSNRQIIM